MKRLLSSLLLCLPAACSGSGDSSQTPDAAIVDVDAEVSPPDASPPDAARPDATPGPPVFLKPEGDGETLDLHVQTCIDLDIVIADPDSTRVVIHQEQPLINGAKLTQNSGLAAAWEWCPTTDQIDFADHWTLQLSANDGTYPPVTKSYVITLIHP